MTPAPTPARSEPPFAPGTTGRIAHALSQFAEAVVVTDTQRRITWVSDGFERLTAWPAAEVIGRRPGEFLQCDRTDRATVARLREALDAGRGFQGRLLNRTRDGREYWVELHVHPVHAEDGPLQGFVAVQSDVTERGRTDTVLRSREALLDTVGRIGGIGGWAIDLRDRRMEWTDQTYRIFDLPLGSPVTADDLVDRCASSHRATLRAAIDRACATVDDESDFDLELPFLTARGTRLWARVVAEMQYDDSGPVRLVGALQDVTQQRATKAEALRNAALLRGAIDVIDEAFVLYDPDDRLLLHNEKYLRVYETSRDLLVPGARFEDIIRQGVRRGQYASAVGREEAWIAERLAQHRTGHSLVEQRLDDGRVLRVIERRMTDGHTVGFRVDITDLVQAREAARRADALKTEFIATISHELRTPLQSIIGFSELGAHFAVDEARFRSMFERIQTGGRRMLTLVNSLLDVARLEGVIGTLELRRHDLGHLVDGVVQDMQPLATGRGQSVQWARPQGPLPIDGDAFRVQQVLRNVLANALNYSPEGGHIALRAARGADGTVTLAVVDDGPGIPVDELEAVFEPFVQSSRTRDGSGGTGLGLAICRRIMGAHGGMIRAVSPVGEGERGTRIDIAWPAATDSLPSAGDDAEAALDAPRPATVFDATTAPASGATA